MSKDNVCPECGSKEMTIESSRELQVTNIYCDNCSFSKSYELPEEDVKELYGTGTDKQEDIVLEQSDIEEMRNSLSSRHGKSTFEKTIDNYIRESNSDEIREAFDSIVPKVRDHSYNYDRSGLYGICRDMYKSALNSQQSEIKELKFQLSGFKGQYNTDEKIINSQQSIIDEAVSIFKRHQSGEPIYGEIHNFLIKIKGANHERPE